MQEYNYEAYDAGCTQSICVTATAELGPALKLKTFWLQSGAQPTDVCLSWSTGVTNSLTLM